MRVRSFILILVGVGIVAMGVKSGMALVSPSPGQSQLDSSGKIASPNKKARWKPSEEEEKIIRQTKALFYGKVVDQYGAAVPRVEIAYHPTIERKHGLSETLTTKADDQGRFEIHEENMPNFSLYVKRGNGYYPTEQSQGIFHFAGIPASAPEALKKRSLAPHRADPANPVIFTLQKMGQTEPMLPRDCAEVLKPENVYQIGTTKKHQALVKFSFDPKTHRVTQYGAPVNTWGVEISVPGGGLAERVDRRSKEPESFIAPVDGYQPIVRISYTAETKDEDYRREINREYFVRFSDGTHARVLFQLRPDLIRKQRPFGVVESWFNPAPGSRATEFDPSKKIEVSTPRR